MNRAMNSPYLPGFEVGRGRAFPDTPEGRRARILTTEDTLRIASVESLARITQMTPAECEAALSWRSTRSNR